MELYPAVDLLGGTAVRLQQGDFDRRTDYGDPVALVRRYADAGARWVHVVDLDAALRGRPVNRRLVLDLVVAAAPLSVQVGGGVRTAEDAEALLDAGAARVVLGTVAARQPALAVALARRFPGQVAVGVDHRRGRVATDGWEADGRLSVADLLAEVADAPLGAVVVTAIDRDGMLSGPDVDGLAEVLAATPHPVVASGGVSSADDLRALAALQAGGRRLAGAIVGRALVDGVVTVEEALVACAPSG